MPEREEFLKDVIVCIAEDYGTNPWRQVTGYRVDDGYLRIIEIEDFDDDSGVEHEITFKDVPAALKFAASEAFGMNSTMVEEITRADRENDAGYLDAYSADAVLQAAIFKEYVYG